MYNEYAQDTLNILICDDDPLVLDRMYHISQNTLPPRWNTAYVCATNPDFLALDPQAIQIAVLDIALEQGDGISLARRLISENPECQILFVSGFPRYVSDVYDVPHLGMVLKDQLTLQLPKFLLRAAESVRACREKALAVPVNRSVLRLQMSGILYLERKEHTTMVYLASGQALHTRKKIGELLTQPCSSSLCRCHVSYAVNLHHVAQLQRQDFLLNDGTRVPISRVYLRTARTAYYSFLQDSL